MQEYVAKKPELQTQLREALKLGVYLIEEAQAGRLKVQYGSPHCLTRMRELLKTLEEPQSLLDTGHSTAIARITAVPAGMVSTMESSWTRPTSTGKTVSSKYPQQV